MGGGHFMIIKQHLLDLNFGGLLTAQEFWNVPVGKLPTH